MFNFLKDKLKKSVENVKKSFNKKEEARKIEDKQEEDKHKKEAKKSKNKQNKKKKKRKPKLFFEKNLSKEEFEKIFKDLEISFLQANVAYDVIQILKNNLKEELVNNPVKRGKVDEKIKNTIKETFEEILIEKDPTDLLEIIKNNKKDGEPTKILFVGVNGVGKTTNMCKLGYWLQKKGYNIVLSASDTFRAASIEQLEKHADNLNVKVIKHKYGSDPAAVAYDTIEYAKAHDIDAVLIDSAGRQHSNANLMDELKKIKRVAKPDMTIFVADALTGNDAIEQAKEFGKIGFDCAILGKADVDTKGGAILSVSYVSEKPIMFLGVGQDYKDLKKFKKEEIISKLLD